MPEGPYHADMIGRIVSGGQTGADRAGLDVAIELGISHGGWVPQGRLAEDGEVPALYNLRETRTRNCLERTKLNVRDSDGTVIFLGLQEVEWVEIGHGGHGKPCWTSV
jgi:predicted Rossmann-fold nucleotide-binding protein